MKDIERERESRTEGDTAGIEGGVICVRERGGQERSLHGAYHFLVKGHGLNDTGPERYHERERERERDSWAERWVEKDILIERDR